MRNFIAQVAHFRNSAGAIKDKRQKRRGARNEHREAMDLFEENSEIIAEIENKDDILDNDKEYQEWLKEHEEESKNIMINFFDSLK